MAHPSLAQIGLGRMGSALAGCFVDAGVPVTVWNRSPEKARRFEGRAMIAPSAASACAAAQIIVVSLSHYSDGIEVLDAAADSTALDGKLLVQLTSGSASDARMMQAWSRAHGLRYLDAAIVAYPKAVGTATATVLYAGDEAVFDAHRETLALLGGNTRFVGEAIGAAATLDCALLEYYYGATLAMFHGAALCQSEDFPLPEYFAGVKAIAPLLDVTNDTGRAMIDKEIYTGAECSLDTHIDALRHIQRMSHDNDVDTKVPDTIVNAYKKAVAAGHGDEEIAAVFEVLKRR